MILSNIPATVTRYQNRLKTDLRLKVKLSPLCLVLADMTWSITLAMYATQSPTDSKCKKNMFSINIELVTLLGTCI